MGGSFRAKNQLDSFSRIATTPACEEQSDRRQTEGRTGKYEATASYTALA